MSSTAAGAAAAAAAESPRWRRENLRIRFPSARSIEETGLDSARCREDISLFSPRPVDMPSADHHQPLNYTSKGEQRRRKLNNRSFRSPSFRFQEDRTDDVAEYAKSSRMERRLKGKRNHWKTVRKSVELDDEDDERELEEPGTSVETPEKHVKHVGVQVDISPETNLLNNPPPFGGSNSPPPFEEEIILKEKSGEGGGAAPQTEESVLARNRWRRLKHTVAFASHMAHLKQQAPNDLLEEKRMEELNEGAGGVGAAAFEGSKTGTQPRLRGRKGMEGLVVRQDKSLISFVQDFYVACLKMPIGYFLVGVFLSPLALSLLFMPLFLLNVDGLTYDEAMAEQGLIGPLASAKETCFAMLNIFLYALSLSTTFGGSPVIAVSPYCLLVANVNTLMAQFLFVFLSGAVFARMSQPSHPIRCSKRAIIRKDDFIPSLTDGPNEQFRVLSIRLVLTGPPPCELVDAKICLTFRIFVALPSGSMFCSTQDLEIVRPEVSYLRYGLMVRHIIDKKSPVYGHTNESLLEGDASFSLTVMGLERASMQPIFHLEDYFVHDGDVVWDADYLDFIQINEKGFRVLDHSKIDLLKSFKAAGNVTRAVARMQRHGERQEEKEEEETETSVSPLRAWACGVRNRKLWKSLSTSFTRAKM